MSDCILGRSRSNARALWIRTHGPLPRGVNVLHTCDQPFCRNIDHLFTGNQSANLRDCIEKGRFKSGFAGHKGSPRSEETKQKLRDAAIKAQAVLRKERMKGGWRPRGWKNDRSRFDSQT